MYINAGVQQQSDVNCMDEDSIFDHLDAVKEEGELWDLLYEYYQQFGALDMSYYHLSPVGSFDFDKKFFTCRGRGQFDIDAYTKKVFAFGESFIPQTRLLDEPVFFAKFCSRLNLTPAQLSLMRGFHCDSTPNGIILPLHGVLGRSGCIVIGFADADRRFSKSEIRRMHWVSQVAHRLYCRLRVASETKPKSLSKRERQVLYWVARGKSNSVIADIIGISPHTVNGYLRSIYLKTGTSDRTTATLRGVGEALMDF